MRVPWAARRSTQSILKEIKPEYSLEGLMLKLQRADSLEKPLMLGRTEVRRRRGQQRMRRLDAIIDSMDMNLSKLWDIVKDREAWACCSPWGCKELDMTEQLNKLLIRESTNQPQTVILTEFLQTLISHDVTDQRRGLEILDTSKITENITKLLLPRETGE